jgi:hypothetical protein
MMVDCSVVAPLCLSNKTPSRSLQARRVPGCGHSLWCPGFRVERAVSVERESREKVPPTRGDEARCACVRPQAQPVKRLPRVFEEIPHWSWLGLTAPLPHCLGHGRVKGLPVSQRFAETAEGNGCRRCMCVQRNPWLVRAWPPTSPRNVRCLRYREIESRRDVAR